MARPRINPECKRLIDGPYSLFMYKMNGKYLALHPTLLSYQRKEKGKFWAIVEVMTLGMVEKQKVWFKSKKDADRFAKDYLTGGVDLSKWRLRSQPKSRGSGKIDQARLIFPLHIFGPGLSLDLPVAEAPVERRHHDQALDPRSDEVSG